MPGFNAQTSLQSDGPLMTILRGEQTIYNKFPSRTQA